MNFSGWPLIDFYGKSHHLVVMVWQFERKDRSRQKKFRNQHTSDLGTLLEEDYVRPWDTHFLCGQPAVLHYTPPTTTTLQV